MEISREEAQDALQQAIETAERTRKLLASRGADALFIVWGAVWFIGYIGIEIAPRLFAVFARGTNLDSKAIAYAINGLWLVLIALGIVLSVVIWRRRAATKTRGGFRTGCFWALLYLYVDLWLFLLWPFIKVSGADDWVRFGRHMGAIGATVPMFAYVIMGLWLDHFMIWVGLAVTALTMAGLYLFPAAFWIWMAVVGGGTLAGTGLLIRNRWRRE